MKHVMPLFKGYPYHCGRCGRNFILFIGPTPPKSSSSSKSKGESQADEQG